MKTGSVAPSFIENIDVSASLDQQLGDLHVSLGQGVMERGEGGVVGGSVDVSSSLWRDKVFPSIVAITLLGVASLFAIY